jgi:NarL family two-component system response regulator LiaR
MAKLAPIRVLIVDDHDMVRSGLTFFLQSFEDLQLVGEAANGTEAVKLCAEVQPDVVLMDLIMPEVDGITAIREIHDNFPDIRLIALTSFPEQNLVTEALKAGAIGYLLKNLSIDELADAIRSAKAGKPVITAEVLKILINPPTQPHALGYNLTKREREILKLLVEGSNNSEIANKLVVSRSTIKTHICNIFEKLGVSNRVGAVTTAIQNHLVE